MLHVAESIEELPGPTLPLKGVKVEAHIYEASNSVLVTQTYFNSTSRPLETFYKFPLPPNAAVTDFTAEFDGRVIQAKLEEAK